MHQNQLPAPSHAKHRGSDYCAAFVKTLYPCRKQQPVYLELVREAALEADL